MEMTADVVVACLRRIQTVLHEQRQYLTDLDSAIGDADHGINMDRGFTAVGAKLDAGTASDVGGVLKLVASTLISTVRRWNAEVFSKDWMKVTLDTSQARDAFGWYYDAFHKRQFMNPALPVQDTFNAGKAAMMITVDISQEKSKTTAAGR